MRELLLGVAFGATPVALGAAVRSERLAQAVMGRSPEAVVLLALVLVVVGLGAVGTRWGLPRNSGKRANELD